MHREDDVQSEHDTTDETVIPRIVGRYSVPKGWIPPFQRSGQHGIESDGEREVTSKQENRPYRNWVEYLNEVIRIPDSQPFKALDLFAGCGGLSLGFEAAGFKTIGYEMVGDCCDTYRTNLHSECVQEKLTTESELPHVDVVIGGPPCQPFSRFGKRKGSDDERNGFPAFIEAIRSIRPSIWMCENVKGLPEQNGDYFKTIVEEMEGLGYIVEYKVFRIVQYDVPQNRERLIMVGHHGGFRFPEPRDYRITAGEALEELAYQIPDDAAFLTKSMDEYIAKYEAASKCRNPRDLHLDRPARTLTCRNLAGATSDMHRIKLPDGRRRRITVREAARLQGFPDWFQFPGNEGKPVHPDRQRRAADVRISSGSEFHRLSQRK